MANVLTPRLADLKVGSAKERYLSLNADLPDSNRRPPACRGLRPGPEACALDGWSDHLMLRPANVHSRRIHAAVSVREEVRQSALGAHTTQANMKADEGTVTAP